VSTRSEEDPAASLSAGTWEDNARASEARSDRYMVGSSHPTVSATGAAVLEAGGSAGDAALAMAAMCFVAIPGMCGVGGDVFCVWYEAETGRYRAVQGSGVGPDGADVDFYRQRGFEAVPVGGPLSVTVPGAMAAIETLHREIGTRPLAELFAPAVAAARDGLPATDGLREDVTDAREKLAADEAAAAVYLPGGEPPLPGATFRQPDLAATIERLAAAPTDFYRGELAERCLRALTAAGAPFSGREWRDTRAEPTETITGTYSDHTVHENRPPSQGYMVLQQAAVLDGVLSELPWLDGRALRWFAGAATLAFADRRRLAGSDSRGWEDLLAPEIAERARAALEADPLPTVPSSIGTGDTTSVVAVDGRGNAVSFICSLAYSFGSGLMVPGTGIVMNDRLGRGAYLHPDHPNGLRPGRRPMHTLNAWIAAAPTGRPAFVGNTPGGDGQVQWNMQVLSHLLDHDAGPGRAAAAPRLTLFPGSDADAVGVRPEVRCESRFNDTALEELRRAGATVVVQEPWGNDGSVQVVAIDAAGGGLCGASDPRGGGVALGG